MPGIILHCYGQKAGRRIQCPKHAFHKGLKWCGSFQLRMDTFPQGGIDCPHQTPLLAQKIGGVLYPHVNIYSFLAHIQSCLMDLMLSICICGTMTHLGWLTDRAELKRQGWQQQDMHMQSHSVTLLSFQESIPGVVPDLQCSGKHCDQGK